MGRLEALAATYFPEILDEFKQYDWRAAEYRHAMHCKRNRTLHDAAEGEYMAAYTNYHTASGRLRQTLHAIGVAKFGMAAQQRSYPGLPLLTKKPAKVATG